MRIIPCRGRAGKSRRGASPLNIYENAQKKGFTSEGCGVILNVREKVRAEEEGAIVMQRMSHAVEYFTFYGFAYFYGKASLGLTAQGAAAGDR